MSIKSLLASAIVLGGIQFAFAAPSTAAPIEIAPGYFDGGAVKWDVQAFRNGSSITLYGTVEEVHAKLLELNPAYDEDFADWVEEHDDGEDDEDNEVPGAAANGTVVEKRTDFSAESAKTDCYNEHTADPDMIRDGIKYLRKVKGKPSNGAGPKNCGRVSCSFKSAIWWCNDEPRPKTLISFGSIADGAQAIYDKCNWKYGTASGSSSGVGGETKHKSNWRVIVVKKGKC